LWCNGIFMEWGDNPICRTCHEIFAVIAVQQLEQNVSRIRFITLLVAVMLFAPAAAFAAGSKPDPMLHAQSQDACRAGADYVDGVDADGKRVVPADVEGRNVPVPSQVVVPLSNRRHGRDGGYVVLEGAQLEPLINPPGCRN
jgi:hypothetical protein